MTEMPAEQLLDTVASIDESSLRIHAPKDLMTAKAIPKRARHELGPTTDLDR